MRKLLPFLCTIVLFGAGCSWNPFAHPPAEPVPTPGEQQTLTPPVVPNEPPAATSTEAAAGWKPFVNGSPAFSFSYPATASATDSVPVFPGDILTLSLGSAAAPSLAQSIPDRSLHLAVVDASDQTIKNCYYSESKWPKGYAPVRTEHATMGGSDVCHSVEVEGAAGSSYFSDIYAVTIGGKAVVFHFVVHSVNCANYDDPAKCVAFDEARDTSLFKDIMQTFRTTGGTAVSALKFERQPISSSSSHLVIDVAYPHLTGFSDARTQETFNVIIDQHVMGVVNQFKKDEASAEAEAPTSFDQKWDLRISYEIHQRDGQRFTVVLTGSEYTGGAHPGSFYETVTYDLGKQKELHLADLFTSSGGYLATVSKYVIEALNAKNATDSFSDAKLIKSGAGPDAKNFQLFYLTDKGITFIFPPYQVAPYAAGSQEVLVPYSAVAGLVLP